MHCTEDVILRVDFQSCVNESFFWYFFVYLLEYVLFNPGDLNDGHLLPNIMYSGYRQPPALKSQNIFSCDIVQNQ
jgi:hypothetical protein